jgi:SSS family transporter
MIRLATPRRISVAVFIALAMSLGACAEASEPAPAASRLQWTTLPQLPPTMGVAGAFVGVHDGALIVAGGSYFNDPSGPKMIGDEIYALVRSADDEYQWRPVGKLPWPAAHGAAVSTEQGLLCIGGTDGAEPIARAFLLRWNAKRNSIEVDLHVPSLPVATSHAAAATIGSTVYVAGGQTASNAATSAFWSLDMSSLANPRAEWKPRGKLPGEPRFGAALVAQNDGHGRRLFLLGGKSGSTYLADGYRYDPTAAAWQAIAPMPRPALLAPAVAAGQSHVLLFGGSDGHAVDGASEFQPDYRFPRDVFAYHTITDRWTRIGEMPQGVAAATAVALEGSFVIPGGELRPKVRTHRVERITFAQPSSRFSALDYAVVAGYLVLLAAVGLRFASREKTSSDFFLGGRRIPWWAAGLSLLATQVSSIGFMAIPAKSFAADWTYFAGVFAWFLVVPIVARWCVPFFMQLGVTSAYEYLHARFHFSLRMFGAVAFSLMQLARTAVVLYLPSLAMSAVTGVDVAVCIVVMGTITTLYTVAGGIEAVVWTDVAQAGMLLFGGAACVAAVVWQLDGGVAEFARIASADDKFRLADWNWDVAAAGLWVVLVGNVFQRFSNLTADQSVVQRYLITVDAGKATRALWTDVIVSILWALIVYLLGTALYVFYKTRPELLDPTVGVDAIVPFFVAEQLPTGLSGLVIAAIFAASMSSLDSSIHSTATVVATDFHGPLRPNASDRSRLLLARCLTLAFGVFATLSALVLSAINVISALDLFIKTIGCSLGILAGLFALGMFTRRAHATGAWIGAIASMIGLYLSVGRVHFFLYPAIGMVVCFAVGYAASRLIPGRRGAKESTVFTTI